MRGIDEGYDLIVTNFANGDVIGHTANREAKIRVRRASWMRGWVRWWTPRSPPDYVVLVTADHGNLEEMTNPDGTPHVAHTTNPVPFIAD